MVSILKKSVRQKLWKEVEEKLIQYSYSEAIIIHMLTIYRLCEIGNQKDDMYCIDYAHNGMLYTLKIGEEDDELVLKVHHFSMIRSFNPDDFLQIWLELERNRIPSLS